MVAIFPTSTFVRICCTISQIRRFPSFATSSIPLQNLLFLHSTIPSVKNCRIVSQHYCCKNNINNSTDYFSDESIQGKMKERTKTIKNLGDENIAHYHYKSISSTQDEMKRLINEENDNMVLNTIIAITSSSQDSGRGTRGRIWLGVPGNLYLTIAIPMSSITIPITLLPLKVGTIVANQISKYIRSPTTKVTVKWPNDILINDLKVSGILIEIQDDYFLIGIGCNILNAPSIEPTGPQRGRKATFLNDYISPNDDDIAQELTNLILNDMIHWIHYTKQTINQYNKILEVEKVINDWSRLFEFGKPYVLRDVGDGNEVVLPIGIEMDGRLKVISEKDGEERFLVADYLF